MAVGDGVPVDVLVGMEEEVAVGSEARVGVRELVAVGPRAEYDATQGSQLCCGTLPAAPWLVLDTGGVELGLVDRSAWTCGAGDVLHSPTTAELREIHAAQMSRVMQRKVFFMRLWSLRGRQGWAAAVATRSWLYRRRDSGGKADRRARSIPGVLKGYVKYLRAAHRH